MREISISVRALVEFIMRGGSIDTGYMSQNRMQEGTRVHRRVQRRRRRDADAKGLVYEAEARLRLSFEYGGLTWNVSGVADGITSGCGVVSIEELKSTYRDLDSLTHDESHWHMAQAKCYGHMYAQIHGTEEVRVELTYCSVESDDTRSFSEYFTADELKAFFYDLVEQYRKWAELAYNKQRLRDETVKAASFPYASYRRGQRVFSVLAYRAIQHRHKLFVEAPTGTGKTISALFPAVKALGEGLADKVFYLTAKTITRQAAVKAVDMLADAGCRLTYVAMTARDKLCFLPERLCQSEICPFANGHFDRVNDALWALLSRTERIGREEIEITARRFVVCPYELMLDASLFADVIICDYNYAFDPTVALKRFFGEHNAGRFALLIDEAHNLVERAREMFSASIRKSDYDSLRAFVGGRGSKARRLIKDIGAEFIKATEDAAQAAVTRAEPPGGLPPLMRDFIETMDRWLAANGGAEGFKQCMETYFKTLDYLRVYDEYGECYTTYLERAGKDAEVSLLCLDPAKNLDATLRKTVSSVFFSATLTPLQYFKNVLGGGENDKTARFPSPFDRENLLVVVEHRISTKYRDRTPRNHGLAADALYGMVSAKKGNYFAFFSSYAQMDGILDAFNARYPEVHTAAQSKDMSEAEKETFLEQFDGNYKEGLLVFAVLGGVFSEGIDLTGERLIGAAIVGVGLPQISVKRDALRAYYDRDAQGGFEYAYQFPGMNKVMQAAGRVIRTETDKGVIMLIDTRFDDPGYRRLFPDEWLSYVKPTGGRGLGEIFSAFWDRA